jgi:hypothetical protein
MKRNLWWGFLCLLLACKGDSEESQIVTSNISLFEKYSPVCERWLEQNMACKKPSCFTAASVEIVGIDTSIADTQSVYAWCWVQDFKIIDQKPLQNKGDFLLARFKVLPTGRGYVVKNIFIPDPDKPLDDQLEENAFPERLMKDYFLNQKKNIELDRIRILSEKARDKYQMYLDKAYIPDADTTGKKL